MHLIQCSKEDKFTNDVPDRIFLQENDQENSLFFYKTGRSDPLNAVR